MTMVNTIVRVYDSLLDAERVRNELLAADFSSACVQLSSRDDEAGPVEGNFITGNGSNEKKGRPDVFYYLIGREDTSYEHNYANVVQRGSYVLTVEVNDENQELRAVSILDRFGATNTDQRTPGSHD
jgi:hypothetical protein